ncbi:MAG: ABC transporter substrate-binding protein [Calditrichaceae bacterium]|nr:ABC transporter substrate-binding protein [Calditrichaceae bacterium]
MCFKINPGCEKFTATILMLVVFIALTACSQKKQTGDAERRVISLAPNITEIIYALGQQSKLAAVTDYCNYPPEAKSKGTVGALLNPNLEKIISLKPDLLIGTPAHRELADKLELKNLKTILLPNDTIDEIFESIDSIGVLLDCRNMAAQLVQSIQDSIESYRINRSLFLNQYPKAMLVLGREPATTRNIGVIGSHNYMDSLWSLTGGINLFSDLNTKFAQVSRENIIDRNPDLIIEFKIDSAWNEDKNQSNQKEWNELNLINAVGHKQIYVIPDESAFIPGPRIYLLAKSYSKIYNKYLGSIK